MLQHLPVCRDLEHLSWCMVIGNSLFSLLALALSSLPGSQGLRSCPEAWGRELHPPPLRGACLCLGTSAANPAREAARVPMKRDTGRHFSFPRLDLF